MDRLRDLKCGFLEMKAFFIGIRWAHRWERVRKTEISVALIMELAH
jgi:hypothetical protein